MTAVVVAISKSLLKNIELIDRGWDDHVKTWNARSWNCYFE